MVCGLKFAKSEEQVAMGFHDCSELGECARSVVFRVKKMVLILGFWNLEEQLPELKGGLQVGKVEFVHEEKQEGENYLKWKIHQEEELAGQGPLEENLI